MNSSLQIRVCVACIAALYGSVLADDTPPELRTRAEVKAAIGRLENKETRLAALEQLIPFAVTGKYQVSSLGNTTGDEEKDALIRKARAAIVRYHNFETFSMALNSSSETLQEWTLFNITAPPYLVTDDPWEVYIPRLRKLATSANSNIRHLAHDRLFHFEGQREFLTERLWAETSLSNVMRLLHDLDRSSYQQDMNSHVLRFLNGDEKAVRVEALSFVARNSRNARLWRVDFSAQVLSKVLELSHSASAAERSSAVSALTGLRKGYRLRKRQCDAVRQRILKLADDPSASVRKVVPLGMRDDDLEHPEVQAVLARLLKDESPLVRYRAIVKLGPEKHADELRELASGSDQYVAELAKRRLKQLDQKSP